MLTRAAMGFLGLFFTASALLLMWLVFLAGTRNSNPLNIIYFLQADTSGIPGAPSSSRWTFWNLCPVSGGKSVCAGNTPTFPLDPPGSRNFGTTTNVPGEFIDSNHYFLTSRFMFPFMIIALFFGVASFFTGFLSLCTRIGGYLSALLAHLALFFQTIVTCLMTAVYVQGRNAFNRNGQSASVGVKAFAFMWTAVVCLFLANLLYCIGGTVKPKDGGYNGREQRRRGFFSSKRSNSVRSNKETNV